MCTIEVHQRIILSPTRADPHDDVVEPLPHVEDRFPVRLVALSVVVSIALRARFITTPLTSDEGGYMAVARAWASGKSLYTDAWVDRPQGLVVLFRVWDDITGGSPESIRVMAILFGCVAVVAVGFVVFTIAGPRAGAIASLLVAIASSNARIEGFIANGELLAGATATAGVAAACAYLFRGQGERWLIVSGLLAGCAISLKQSGFDGFMAVLVCLIAGGFTRETTWRRVLRECALCITGLLAVVAVLVVHGVIVGFSAWWYAIAGYRIGGINGAEGDWARFWITSHIAAPTILPLAIVAGAGVLFWLARDRHVTRASVLIPAWLCFASVAFLAGGLFHRHYWITLTFPFAAAAAVAIAPRRRHGVNGLVLLAIAVVVAIPSLISTKEVIGLDRDEAALIAHNDPRLTVDEGVAQWYKDNRTTDSTIYVMCASAGVYATANAIPPYPYLWLDGVQHGRDSQQKLIELFQGDHPPTFVALYQRTSTCNPSGDVERLLRERYSTVDVVRGSRILRVRTDVTPGDLSGRNPLYPPA